MYLSWGEILDLVHVDEIKAYASVSSIWRQLVVDVICEVCHVPAPTLSLQLLILQRKGQSSSDQYCTNFVLGHACSKLCSSFIVVLMFVLPAWVSKRYFMSGALVCCEVFCNENTSFGLVTYYVSDVGRLPVVDILRGFHDCGFRDIC